MYRNKKICALIPAAGSGTRMGMGLKKQYLTLNGKEILNWTLENLMGHDSIDEAVIIVPTEDLEAVLEKVTRWLDDVRIRKPFKVIAGGTTRQASVYQGLLELDGHTDYVLIHDGVRPFVPHSQINAFLDAIMDDGISGVIAGIQVTDTLKRVDNGQLIIETLDRASTWAVQTPQIFDYEPLKAAHEVAIERQLTATDDAALLEILGKRTKIVQSDAENIKITKPFDLIVAEAIIRTKYGISIK